MRFFSCFLLYLLPIVVFGQDKKDFDLTLNCRYAYGSIMDLRLEDANQWLEYESQENPNNLLLHLFENYIEALIVQFDEQESALRAYENSKNERLKKIQEGNANSPFFLYSQAEIKLQSAFVRLKFEEYLTAAWEIRQAYQLLESNQAKFPEFSPNLKSLAYIHAIVGTLPDTYKWIVKILGLSGDVKQGLSELDTFIKTSKEQEYPFYREAQLVHAFFLIFIDTQYDAARYIINNDLTPETSLLDAYVAANISYRLGEVDKGIEFLENHPRTAEFYPIYIADYILGTLKLYRLDKDANVYLEYFLNNFKGRHYVKDAYQKLAWYYLLNDQKEQYHFYINQIANNGATLIDTDKKAQKEAETGNIPHIELLKAQLFFDGGYYQKSLDVLNKLERNNLPNQSTQVEYIYRIARNHECLSNWDQSIAKYKQTIEESPTESALYFAPKSALQLGLIYERLEEKELAAQFYKLTLTYKNHPYKNTIDQQAKAGLNRIQ